MKKIFILIFLIIVNIHNVLAYDEINLNTQSSLFQYLSKVYYDETDNNNDVSPILQLFSKKGMKFENSYIDTLKLSFYYSGQMNFTKMSNETPSFNHDFTSIEPGIKLNFNENKTNLVYSYNFTRDLEGYSNDFTERISKLYISHNITPNQTILIGQGERIPNSYDGSKSTMTQEMVLKSQLGRTLGNVRSVGIRNIAAYKYLDYDIGLYDSTRYMKNFGKGADFTGQIVFKPFSNINSEYGDLKLGAAYNIGNYNNSYSIYSAFLDYKYKNFHIRTEYANADGYNSIHESGNRADGLYGIVSYNITPKLALLGRYDYFAGDRNNKSSYSQEYTLGVTYNIFKNMKMMVNYVNKNSTNQQDSNMILFATRFII